MYINEFVCGILTTLGVEMLAIFGMAIYQSVKKKK